MSYQQSYQEFQPSLAYINSSIQIQILVVAKDIRYVTEVDKNTATIHDINQFVGEQLSLQSTSKITAIYQGNVLLPEKHIGYYFNNDLDINDPNDVISIHMENIGGRNYFS